MFHEKLPIDSIKALCERLINIIDSKGTKNPLCDSGLADLATSELSFTYRL